MVWELVLYFKKTILFCLLAFLGACATSQESEQVRPIENPFGSFYSKKDAQEEKLILRTQQGKRSFEIELPKQTSSMSELVLPADLQLGGKGKSPSGGRSPSSLSSSSAGTDSDNQPTRSDHEITQSFPQGDPETRQKRNAIEKGLGLMPAQDDTPKHDQSYLAALDQIKNLFKGERYEEALRRVDNLLKKYPTSPKLYKMRGTLLDRVGHEKLAIQAWKQSLSLDPQNQRLKKFLKRKKKNRQRRRAKAP